MPTTRFCQLVGIPERTYRRWQAHARVGRPAKGPWPRPARETSREFITALAARHAAWEHRKIWAMARHAGHRVSMSTTARIMDDAGLLLKADYQRERPQLAQARKTAFAKTPTGPNMVWQFDFSEYETSKGGTWRVAGIADYWLFTLERGGVLEGGFESVGVSAGSSWPEYGTGSWPGCGSHVRCT